MALAGRNRDRRLDSLDISNRAESGRMSFHTRELPKRKDDMTITMEKPLLGSAAAEFLGKEHKLFIGGKWAAAKSGKTLAVEDPATQETITYVPAGDKDDIDLAVGAAR